MCLATLETLRETSGWIRMASMSTLPKPRSWRTAEIGHICFWTSCQKHDTPCNYLQASNLGTVIGCTLGIKEPEVGLRRNYKTLATDVVRIEFPRTWLRTLKVTAYRAGSYSSQFSMDMRSHVNKDSVDLRRTHFAPVPYSEPVQVYGLSLTNRT